MNQEIETKEKKEVEKIKTAPSYIPPVDIYERQDRIVVVAEMPGLDESSIDVHFEKDILLIKGQVKQNKREGFKPVYSEYGMGDYERSFSVPEGIDVERIEASIKNGLLTVTLPKAQRPESRQIKVNVQ